MCSTSRKSDVQRRDEQRDAADERDERARRAAARARPSPRVSGISDEVEDDQRPRASPRSDELRRDDRERHELAREAHLADQVRRCRRIDRDADLQRRREEDPDGEPGRAGTAGSAAIAADAFQSSAKTSR